jgi:hypothetical protein
VDENAARTTGHRTAGAGAHAGADGGEVATNVLRRLERIEALDRVRAPAGTILGELRELVHEAEAWARLGAREPTSDGVRKLRGKAEGMR